MYSKQTNSEKAPLQLAPNILFSVRALVRVWALFHSSCDITCPDHLNLHSALSIFFPLILDAARRGQFTVVESICLIRKQLKQTTALACAVLFFAALPALSEEKLSEISAEEYLIQEFFQTSEVTEKEKRNNRKTRPGLEQAFSRYRTAMSRIEGRLKQARLG